MKQEKLPLVLLLGSALFLGAPLTALGASADKMAKQCDDCHGKKGNSEDEDVPSIAGFSSVTIEDILTQYQSGDREGRKHETSDGKETDMNKITKDMDEEDIKVISEYYAKLEFVPRTQKFDAKLAKKGAKVHDRKCEKCHSDEGTNPEDDAAILAGQWRAYLEREFDLIKKGERSVPKKMKKKFKKLKDKQYQELIEFYVSQQ